MIGDTPFILGPRPSQTKQKMAKKTPKGDKKKFLYLAVSSICLIIYECSS